MSLLLTPHVSEKAIALAERNVYVFEVPMTANKIEVAKAVKEAFQVEVEAVNMAIIKGKPSSKRYGKNAGRRKDLKKAMITVKKGQSIKLFEGAK
ncbi:MAG TPA: 50S ribosomal protein L23 [Candidatus Dormibacteraeota bacterium]|nr:50S ribosomal protein L23 [Candidatus Dormibacteraeota bacterium]